MQAFDEDYESEPTVEMGFVRTCECTERVRDIRERIEYWHELRRLRKLLDDPEFSDL